MKTTILIFSMLCSAIFCNSQDRLNHERCVPFLINRNGKVCIEDSHIKDTLKIQFRVIVNFEHPLLDTTTFYVVKSVDLIGLTVHSLNLQKVVVSLSNVIEIKSPEEQYIWDLCYAKLSYWYKYQPYKELPEKERTRYGDRIYMGGILYLVPKNCEFD